LLPHLMVQTEGWMMDTAFLEKIRRQEDLISVLREYGVRYYISSVDFKRNDRAFMPSSPFAQGRPRRICAPSFACRRCSSTT
jgi:hypothetical protein